MTRKNLIVVRAGEQSHHQRWLGAERTWDLFVSYYGSNSGRYSTDGEYYQARPGGCWSGNAAALDELGELVTEYDYIAFANDDMYAPAAQWDRLFAVCARYGIDFGHPAVIRNSLATLRPKPFVYRTVRKLPDINVPVLSRRAIEAVRPTFAESEVGLGLMWVWPKLCPSFVTAIIDSAPVDHMRPLGKGDRVEFERRTGISGEDEMAAMLGRYGINLGKSV